MKLFLVCVLSAVGLCLAKPSSDLPELPTIAPPTHSRGCIYILGKCKEECPEGTHAYTTGCSPKTPEPTCEEPNPVQEKYALCDYSNCYCDPPTVRDTVSKKCVKLEDCPKKEAKPEKP